ncbi:ABC transporter ATP-binding protein [Alphaproteobacteria bacterium LSUCC0226]
MPDRVLEVKNLSVDIPLAEGVLHAVDDLNIHVDKGETLCIVGESGCGKSLTSLAIMDLLPKKAIRRLRQLDLAGTSILDYSEKQMSDIRGNKMGMIFQEPMTSLNPAFTIGNQMIETLHRHRTISGDEARDLAKRMLEKVGITAADQRLGQYPHQLSGGLRQRVMIAMTLLCEPELIIADEPTTALDVTIQAQILLLLKDLQNEFDMGLMLITHDLGVVARIATRVAVMYAGQIVEQGTAQQIFENPLHPYTRGLMRCIPVPGKTKRGTPLGSIPGMVPSLIGEFTGCRFVDRCDMASDACRQSDISLRDPKGKTQAYRCIHDAKTLAKSEVA